MNRAFALIEILIVALIVAILAVAAIPKQRERRALSQYASCRADMYSLAMAIEAYHVEWDDYPYYPDPDFASSGFMNSDNIETLELWMGYTPWTLTTPVAYLQHLPRDAFVRLHYEPGMVGYNPLRLYHYEHRDSPNGYMWKYCVPQGANYLVLGVGPDQITWITTSASSGDGIHNNAIEYLQIRSGAIGVSGFYDPTNGATSWGDIVYHGPDIGFEPTRMIQFD